MEGRTSPSIPSAGKELPKRLSGDQDSSFSRSPDYVPFGTGGHPHVRSALPRNSVKSTVGNTIAGGVRVWLMGESLGGGGDVLGVRKTVRTNPSPVANKIIHIREGILWLSNEGSRRIEDGDLGKPSTRGHIRRSPRQFILPFPSPRHSC